MTENTYHLLHCLRQRMAEHPLRTALRYRQQGEWHDISWQSLSEQVEQLSYALLAQGFGVQDKVGIFAQNMPQWTIADLAALQVRAVSVPIYATNTADQAAYIVNDADIRVLFVGDQQQYDQAISVADNCPQLEVIVAMKDDVDLRDHALGQHWQTFMAKGDVRDTATFEQRLATASMDDLVTLIYTSGTTGEPKGVMIDYANFAHQLESHNVRLNVTEKDVSISFLPLSHVFERAWCFYVLYCGGTNCYLENTNEVREALTEIRPTVMCAVPRFYEKIFSAIHEKVARAPMQRKMVFTWAVNMGARMAACRQANKPASWLLRKSYALADKLVLSKLRRLLGGNIRFMPCGGAKLEPSIGRFFHAIGVDVKLGYGMTETVATISCWEDGRFEPDSIGTVMPGTEVKIGDDNEILVRGGMVMRGYYKRPEETAATFTADGFMKTGDAGHFDENGNLFITDRIKELMKTSNGKYIAPQLIEGKIGCDHFIEQIAVIADTRKFVSALIVPCFDSLEAYAKELNIAYHDRLELIKHSQVVEMFEARLMELQKELAKFEQVKKFTLLPQAFSMDLGELTPTLKLRRKVISERYMEQIEAMYREPKKA
ncbi:Long-chain-fatty-acid--CoA ligase FadD15 [Vibrio stylophorae]|uniref:Long-chain-fatty-acid--CoA ligase FadD15 n=1 Tax=Vibrio stylophorae TaxID=659351 RepID=A0ABN8DMV7_9VIBR|nr:long-chain fatty acid--CoA ligase [Vibrio stylophorae]CAH0532446.1 Long-chain-fatty-acid--CoA ligase FadD15 [Vibrio stylophorae]